MSYEPCPVHFVTSAIYLPMMFQDNTLQGPGDALQPNVFGWMDHFQIPPTAFSETVGGVRGC